MQKSTLEFLRCPVCYSDLTLSIKDELKGQIISGSLNCKSGKHQFPILLDRPILIPTSLISDWIAPIDECIGVLDKKVLPPLSLP